MSEINVEHVAAMFDLPPRLLAMLEPPSQQAVAAAARLGLEYDKLACATPTKAFRKIAMALRGFRRHPTSRGQRIHARRRKAAERRRA